MLLACEKFVDNGDKLRWILFARIVARACDRHNLCLRQDFAEFGLCGGRYNRASSTQDVNDGRLDLSHKSPKLRWHESVTDRRITLPDNAPVRARFRPVVNVCS